MKLMTAADLKALSYGDTVYRFADGRFRKLRFVGLMPSCKNYLIFEDGEYLTHLHISSKDDSFNGDWYSGKYSSKFVGEKMVEALERKIKVIKVVYNRED